MPLSTGVVPLRGSPPPMSVEVGGDRRTAIVIDDDLAQVRLGELSVLVMVQVALTPRPTVTLLPFWVPPTQIQALAV